MMVLKELRQLAKKNAGYELSLYYTAYELEEGKMLSIIRFK